MSALDDVGAQEQKKFRKNLWAGSEDLDYAAEDTKDLSTCGERGEGNGMEWQKCQRTGSPTGAKEMQKNRS